MKTILSEYGLVIIAIVIVIAGIGIIQYTEHLSKSEYDKHDIYMNEDGNKINGVTDLMNSIDTPVIKINASDAYTIPSGNYGDTMIFATSEDVRKLFIPDELTIDINGSTINKNSLINDPNFIVDIDLYTIGLHDEVITDSFGNPIMENGQPVIRSINGFKYDETYSDADESGSCKKLNELTIDCNQTYKFKVTYRYTANNNLKAESTCLFLHKCAINNIKDPI